MAPRHLPFALALALASAALALLPPLLGEGLPGALEPSHHYHRDTLASEAGKRRAEEGAHAAGGGGSGRGLHAEHSHSGLSTLRVAVPTAEEAAAGESTRIFFTLDCTGEGCDFQRPPWWEGGAEGGGGASVGAGLAQGGGGVLTTHPVYAAVLAVMASSALAMLAGLAAWIWASMKHVTEPEAL
jgi:hypothetical protein